MMGSGSDGWCSPNYGVVLSCRNTGSILLLMERLVLNTTGCAINGQDWSWVNCQFFKSSIVQAGNGRKVL